MPNEHMSLEQLEKLAKNPNYTLSDFQVERLNRLREEKRLTFKHDTSFKKQTQPINKHETELDDGKPN